MLWKIRELLLRVLNLKTDKTSLISKSWYRIHLNISLSILALYPFLMKTKMNDENPNFCYLRGIHGDSRESHITIVLLHYVDCACHSSHLSQLAESTRGLQPVILSSEPL